MSKGILLALTLMLACRSELYISKKLTFPEINIPNLTKLYTTEINNHRSELRLISTGLTVFSPNDTVAVRNDYTDSELDQQGYTTNAAKRAYRDFVDSIDQVLLEIESQINQAPFTNKRKRLTLAVYIRDNFFAETRYLNLNNLAYSFLDELLITPATLIGEFLIPKKEVDPKSDDQDLTSIIEENKGFIGIEKVALRTLRKNEKKYSDHKNPLFIENLRDSESYQQCGQKQASLDFITELELFAMELDSNDAERLIFLGDVKKRTDCSIIFRANKNANLLRYLRGATLVFTVKMDLTDEPVHIAGYVLPKIGLELDSDRVMDYLVWLLEPEN